ncbi:Glucan 1,3-beta-glucosidase [Colletotrichum orbiculare MAFF 240422]|uniref:glucan 1,3-beta-glucosidase n=1 Tax=Colletotrichum orbiculare (strain 104-T / ATCC 96160 / CBS 514.97 / LARS 414 / MAFF 240422) TaxID=1213857 RepID=A0A484FKI0_COLOR|nr:Glucan 1,3-beta-glucosidase [Colletotrichum orbiculare MAFF 240422]
MRISTVVTAVLACAPGLASAALGFALGAKQPDGQCKLQADYEADFRAIREASESNIVRIYAADQCNTAKEVLPAAKKEDFKVVLGIWADTDESYAADKAAVVRHSPGFEDQVYAVTVGSESLYRGNFTGPELADKLKDMKKATPHFKVGTADTWNKFNDGTADAVIRQADILLANAFSFWQGQAAGNASSYFLDNIAQALARQAGPVKWGFNVFFFEAFDEPWKPHAISEEGFEAPEVHWGGMTADRRAKYPLKC